jgi:hypothetical protein
MVSSSEDQDSSDCSEDRADGTSEFSCLESEIEMSECDDSEVSKTGFSSGCEASVSCFVGYFSGFLGGYRSSVTEALLNETLTVPVDIFEIFSCFSTFFFCFSTTCSCNSKL